MRAFSGNHFVIRAGGGAFAAHREHVAFDVDVERFKTHTRQIDSTTI